MNKWSERWNSGNTGWDLHGAHPRTAELVAKWEQLSGESIETQKIWVPGCGHAHDAAWLAQHGARVLASDLVGLAIEAANSLYGRVDNLTLKQEDCLINDQSTESSCSVIFDRAMLCALQGEERLRYVESCMHRLQANGCFLSLAFTKVAYPPGKLTGPPFTIDRGEALRLFGTNCKLMFWRDLNEPSLDGLIQAEALMIWQKV